MSISSSERPLVSGMSLHGAESAIDTFRGETGRQGDAQAEDRHATDVDGGEHQEDLVPKRSLHRGSPLGDNEVEEPL